MPSAFNKEMSETIEPMPLILKLIFGASLVLGLLQIFAIAFPLLSPRILGNSIGSPLLMLIMGVIHVAIGLGIYKKRKWAVALIVLLPAFQFGALYIDRGFVSQQELMSTLIIVLAWAVIFTVYFLRGKAESYFRKSSNA